VITVAVRWYLRYGLSYRDVEELLAERGIDVDHVTVYQWVQRFTPLFADVVSAATVRGWLRRLRSAAEAMRRDAMYQLGFVGGLADPPLPGPAASPLGDALNAVAACAHAAITRFGLSRAGLWPLLGRFGLARHLAPARAG
jgi:hypothetical protein